MFTRATFGPPAAGPVLESPENIFLTILALNEYASTVECASRAVCQFPPRAHNAGHTRCLPPLLVAELWKSRVVSLSGRCLYPKHVVLPNGTAALASVHTCDVSANWVPSPVLLRCQDTYCTNPAFVGPSKKYEWVIFRRKRKTFISMWNR